MAPDHRARPSRDEIVSAARELFEESGYEATTMTEVAEKAGVSRRTLFNHFEQKAALLYRGTDEFIERFIAGLADRPLNEPLFVGLTETFRGLVAEKAGEWADDGAGPEVVAARAREDVSTYWRTVWARQIADVVTATRGPGSRMKAELVGALVGQAWTEITRIEQEGGAPDKPRAALLVIDEIGELLYGTPS